MKRLSEMLMESLEEESFEGYIIIITNDDSYGKLTLLNEGEWRHSGEKDYWLRKERENELWHVHIAHERHKRTKIKQVAWREDGKRKVSLRPTPYLPDFLLRRFPELRQQ